MTEIETIDEYRKTFELTNKYRASGNTTDKKSEVIVG